MTDANSLMLGMEWIVDAHGCAPALLASRDTLEAVFVRIVAELGLKPVRDPLWHVFPGAGGVTGVVVLSESHLTCHTYPERGVATFNLYCCRPAHDWPWEERLREFLTATSVSVRVVTRGAAQGELRPLAAAYASPITNSHGRQ